MSRRLFLIYFIYTCMYYFYISNSFVLFFCINKFFIFVYNTVPKPMYVYLVYIPHAVITQKRFLSFFLFVLKH